MNRLEKLGLLWVIGGGNALVSPLTPDAMRVRMFVWMVLGLIVFMYGDLWKGGDYGRIRKVTSQG
jgi:hypothetical protein